MYDSLNVSQVVSKPGYSVNLPVQDTFNTASNPRSKARAISDNKDQKKHIVFSGAPITFTNNSDGFWVMIYSKDGKLTQNIFGKNSVVWNGADFFGKKVCKGVYNAVMIPSTQEYRLVDITSQLKGGISFEGEDLAKTQLAYQLVKEKKWNEVVKLGKAAIPALRDAGISKGVKDAINMFGEIKNESAVLILQGLMMNPPDGEPYVGIAAAQALGKNKLAVIVLRKALKDGCGFAAIGLAAHEYQSVRSVLLESLRNSNDEYLSEAIAEVIADNGDKTAIPNLKEELKRVYRDEEENHDSNYVSNKYEAVAIAGNLLRLGDRSNLVIKVLVKARDKWQFEGPVAEALGKSGDKSFTPHLRIILKSNNPGSRLDAAEALYKLGAMGNQEIQAYRLLISYDDVTKRFNELVRLGPAIIPILKAELKSKYILFLRSEYGLSISNEEVRSLAARVLGVIGDNSMIPDLESAGKNDESEAVRAAADKAIQAIQSRESQKKSSNLKPGGTK